MKTLNMRLHFLWVVLWIVVPASARLQPARSPIVTTDLMKIKIMSDLQISPDGNQLVFVLTAMTQSDDNQFGYDRQLWLADLDGDRAPRQLTFGHRNDRSPVWSPDGKKIAFVRNNKENSQIWILPLAGGEAFPVTEAEFGASRPRWSPDGTQLLFVAEVPEWKLEVPPPWPDERPGRHYGDEPNWKRLKAEKKDTAAAGASADGTLEQIRAWLAKNAAENNPRVFTRLNLQGEFDLRANLSFSHLFLTEPRPGAAVRQLTSGWQDFRSPEWAPNGRQVVCESTVYTRHPDRNRTAALWVVDASLGGAKELLRVPGYLLSRPQYSPNGEQILFVASDSSREGFAQRQLGLVGASGGPFRWLAAGFDRSVSDPQWSRDGAFVYFTAASEGSFPLYRLPSAGGQVQAVVGGARGIRDFALGASSLAFAMTEVRNPYELYTAKLDGRNPRRLSDFNESWLAGRRIIAPDVAWLSQPDGMRIQYWVMQPLDIAAGTKYPLILEMHGGPSAMWGPGEFTMWHEFQLLAGRGYGVVFCNPRGSGGYGYDFQHGNYQNWGAGPANDILAVADAAARLTWVDADQQFITGGSYAGYMTAWIVSQDHRFKAAVAQRGVYDLSVFFGEGNAWRLVPRHFGGYPWETDIREILNANSPQTFVANITTPLLIMHADNDLRTGFVQSELLYKSLKVLERPVEYVRYPGEGHDLSRSGNPLRRMDRLDRILEFFERYTRHPQPPSGAGEN